MSPTTFHYKGHKVQMTRTPGAKEWDITIFGWAGEPNEVYRPSRMCAADVKKAMKALIDAWIAAPC